MRKSLLFLALIFIIGTVAFGYGGKPGVKYADHDDHNFNSFMNNVDIDFKGSTLVIESRHGQRPVVEITDDYRLFVNDESIKINDEQKKLVAEFYDKTYELYERAKIVGLEGAKIGLEGAKLGAGTITSLFKLLSPSYDTDDLEQEVEAKAKNIEKKAEKLEREAEELEIIAEDMEKIYEEMEVEIEELEELEWY